MGQIFISYRRNDAPAAAGRIYDALVDVFGKERVFKDVDAIGAGEDFEEVIRAKLRQTVVVVSVVGERWEGYRGFLRKPRVFDDKDWVRVELELARSFRIPVIPVLIDRNAPPSSHSLPTALQYLTKLQSPQLRHERWADDIAVIIKEIQSSYGKDLGLDPTTDEPRLGETKISADIYVCFRLSDVPEVAQRVVQEMQRQFPDSSIGTSNDVANLAPADSTPLRNEITDQTTVLVLIGNGWLGAKSLTGERRLEQEGDYVRVAIEHALKNSARVIPIMVDDAMFPSPHDLPSSIGRLTHRNALSLTTEAEGSSKVCVH
jgi:TIR domain